MVSFESEEQEKLYLDPELYWTPPDDREDDAEHTPGVWCTIELAEEDEDEDPGAESE